MHKIKLFSLVSACFALFSLSVFAQDEAAESYDGKALFTAKCASCHKPIGGSSAPALQGARQRWKDAGEEELIYEWIENNVALKQSGKSKRAIAISAEWNNAPMSAFAGIKKGEIDAILSYVDGYVAPGGGGDVAAGGGASEEEESGTNWWLLALAAGLGVVVFAAAGARKKLQYVAAAQRGEEPEEEKPFSERLGIWVYKNWLFALVIFVVVLFGGLSDLFGRLYQIGVYQDYQPSQVVAYDHSLHAGKMEIDCRYCHNSVEKSKHAGLPTTNVCMNCHRVVHESEKPGSADEIAKLHKAAGYSVEKKDYNRDAEGNVIEGDPIVWNKAHNLPDHVFFSHKQHVNVGKVDCMQCHGDVKTYTLGRVASTEEINKLVAQYPDKVIPLTKPLLTMGWCIECHKEKGIDVSADADNAYYQEIHNRLKNRPDVYKKYLDDDEKISVKELGGWECAKCHY